MDLDEIISQFDPNMPLDLTKVPTATWSIMQYVGNTIQQLQQRNLYTRQYAWAIPSEEAITLLVKYSPLVEIGAGGGYWASLIRKAGGVIHAYDKNIESLQECHTEVLPGNEFNVTRHPDCTLFLCWPPYNDPMAHRALTLYKGTRVVYVGESDGGCTADDDFHNELNENWTEVTTLDIPQWPAIHDYLTVYTRAPQPNYRKVTLEDA